jgi:hypothetical protein
LFFAYQKKLFSHFRIANQLLKNTKTSCATFGKKRKLNEFYNKFKVMTGIDKIKNNLIDRILATRNEKLLKAISYIFESTQSDDILSLTSEQIEMLLMSDKDIENGNIISESDLNDADSKWLN